MSSGPILDREEYIEQAYFFHVLRERMQQNAPAQEILEPGMVLSVTGYVWHEGVGAVLGREAVLVTPDGQKMLVSVGSHSNNDDDGKDNPAATFAVSAAAAAV